MIAEGMKPTLLGVTLGAFGAYALGGVLSKLIYGVSAADPVTLLLAAGTLSVATLAACYVPARRAARVDPARTLATD